MQRRRRFGVGGGLRLRLGGDRDALKLPDEFVAAARLGFGANVGVVVGFGDSLTAV